VWRVVNETEERSIKAVVIYLYSVPSVRTRNTISFPTMEFWYMVKDCVAVLGGLEELREHRMQV
jgi:hypothetical protein